MSRLKCGCVVVLAIVLSACATSPSSSDEVAIGTFGSNPSTIAVGSTSTLSWNSITNATGCTINNGVGAVSCTNSSATVSPTVTTTYTLTATGPGGSATATATVTVRSVSDR